MLRVGCAGCRQHRFCLLRIDGITVATQPTLRGGGLATNREERNPEEREPATALRESSHRVAMTIRTVQKLLTEILDSGTDAIDKNIVRYSSQE